MRPSLFFAAIFIPLLISAQEQTFKGYPSREKVEHLQENFRKPPKGYGNVPFYWWNGDSLKRERLEEQLNILSQAPIDGFAVSYIHTSPKIDYEKNKNGYGMFGRSDKGVPDAFSEEWWTTWNWFSGLCEKKGIGLGLDDYTVGWTGNGYYPDRLRNDSSFASYQGRLKFETYEVHPKESFEIKIKPHFLKALAYAGQKQIDLSHAIRQNKLSWMAPADTSYKIYLIYTRPGYELHPEHGKRMVREYFDQFDRKLDEQGKKGLNYFFQDELFYDLTLLSWSEDMASEFKKRKGYDILPYLPALIDNIGDITPKIRLDYAEVLTQMGEERYFKPIYDWHADRGLIYGCDNMGRGKNPVEYLDYFRAISWFTAPGNDAPAKGSSFIQTKVSSSISHLYQRPRTWLEAFHSMGWNSNGEWLSEQIDHHLLAGGNLVCLHGLYYTTHGGWWEWAPPCFHFRMPYWPHMIKWLEYTERLCYLLSQGVHVCDIAIMYPTESMLAYPDATANVCFELADSLSRRGLDYDFIDYQSLQKSTVSGGDLHVSGEKYKVLILPDMKAMHYGSLLKVLEFYRNGGIVLAAGALPNASSRIGANDEEVAKIVNEIFKENPTGKGFYGPDTKQIYEKIPQWITPDFVPEKGTGRVLHRRIDDHDVYMVANVEKNSRMFFRSVGKAELWDARDGGIKPLPIISQSDTGTWIRFDGEPNNSRLIVFSPGVPVLEDARNAEIQQADSMPVEGEWEVEIIPTMNNKWGDFRLPASNELIGPESRSFAYYLDDEGRFSDNRLPEINKALMQKSIYGYAPQMERLILPLDVDLIHYAESYMKNRDEVGEWEPYLFSWQYGVFDNPGSQGYHGLKAKVDDNFIILDKKGHHVFRTWVYAPNPGIYRLIQEGVSPSFIFMDGKEIKPGTLELTAGWHSLFFAYGNIFKQDYKMFETKAFLNDTRPRSNLVFLPVNVPEPEDVSAFADIVASKWYRCDHLMYDPYARQEGTWIYEFETAPAVKEMKLCVKGEIEQLWMDGKKLRLPSPENDRANSCRTYIVKIQTANPGISKILMSAKPDLGYQGAGIFAAPVKYECGVGRMKEGDWSKQGALLYYSGGMRYKKNVMLPSDRKKNTRIKLDLGQVDATCEVKINGKEAGFLIGSPFVLDITDFVKPGLNKLDILVYSTLSNHYQDIPTPYRGEPKAGLIGPVNLIYTKEKR